MDPNHLIAQALNDDTHRRLHRRWRYYQGQQPRRWVTSKMARLFGALTDAMSENYCALAVTTRATRMEITGWTGPGETAATGLWEPGHWPARQADLYRWGLAYGRAYLIAANDDSGPAIYANRPTLIWADDDEGDPYTVANAVKVWWDAGTPAWRATVWTPTDAWRYLWPALDRAHRPGNANDAVPDPDDPGGPHGLDGCPVVPIHPYGLDAPVLLDMLAPVQDRVNKISANKFVAAEFGAFRQRVFFTRQDVDDADLVNAPDTAIILDPGEKDAPTRVQELSATDLANYDNSLQREVHALFTLGLLPRHLLVNPGVPPSGEAIRADEAPLVEAIRDHQREFGEGFRRALALLGIDAEPAWRNPEAANEGLVASTVRQFTDAGLPWEAVVTRYAGWDDEDVTEAAEIKAAKAPGPGIGPTMIGGTPQGAEENRRVTDTPER